MDLGTCYISAAHCVHSLLSRPGQAGLVWVDKDSKTAPASMLNGAVRISHSRFYLGFLCPHLLALWSGDLLAVCNDALLPLQNLTTPTRP